MENGGNAGAETAAKGGAVAEFNVGMTCGGCQKAVMRILGKIPGVTNIDASVEAKKVLVQYSEPATPEIMLTKLLKWGKASGKTVELVGAPAA